MMIGTTVDDTTLDGLIRRIRKDTASGFPPKKLVISTPAIDRLEAEASERWNLVSDPAARAPSLHGVPIEVEKHHEDRVRIIYADDHQPEQPR
jgi:hypothetical protein